MPIDPNIPLGIHQQNPMQPLSNLLNIANTQQGMQARALQMQGMQQQNEQGGIDLQERKSLQPLLSDPSKYTDQNGDVDFNKATSMIMSAAPTTGLNYIKALYAAQQQKTVAQQTIAQQSDQNNARVSAALASIPPDASPEVVRKTMETIKGMYPNQDMQNVLGQMQGHLNTAMQNPDAKIRAQALQTASRMFSPPTVQQAMATPEGIVVSNGQVSGVVSTKPGTTAPQGEFIPGTRQQQELPPATPTFDKATNTPGYLGAQSHGNFPSVSSQQQNERDGERLKVLQDELKNESNPDNRARLQREIQATQQGIAQRSNPGSQKGGFVPSGPALGQEKNIGDNVDQMSRHFSGLQDQAAGAPMVTALTGNIKSLANDAITGTEAGKKKYLFGLMNALHIGGQYTGDLQKDTDLLEKQMAQLNLNTPASTDAARTLVQAARPNSHMSAGAISEAADQIASQVKANMAMRNVLSSYKQYGDVQGYNNMRQKLEQTADPRIWQYESLPKEQRAAFMQKLQPQDRADLVNKAKQLTDMGIIK